MQDIFKFILNKDFIFDKSVYANFLDHKEYFELVCSWWHNELTYKSGYTIDGILLIPGKVKANIIEKQDQKSHPYFFT